MIRAVAVLVGVMLACAPAVASVGVADVDMSVSVPRAADGRRVVVARGEPATVEVVLRNLADEPRSVQLHLAGANVDEEGSVEVGGHSDVAWLGFEPRTLALGPGEQTVVEVPIDPRRAPRGDIAVAFVLSAPGAGSVQTRAASVVHLVLEPPAPPWALYFLALALLLLVAAAVTRQLSRTSPAPALRTPPAPSPG